MIHAGWRFFECSGCGTRWKEACRDYKTPSSSVCPNESCEGGSYGVSPYKAEDDPHLPVDDFGNLLNNELIMM